MEKLQKDPTFCQFHASIEEILQCRVTIEQESMLEALSESSNI
jgi:hypothetical protein